MNLTMLVEGLFDIIIMHLVFFPFMYGRRDHKFHFHSFDSSNPRYTLHQKYM